jgi:hypothetical protein
MRQKDGWGLEGAEALAFVRTNELKMDRFIGAWNLRFLGRLDVGAWSLNLIWRHFDMIKIDAFILRGKSEQAR